MIRVKIGFIKNEVDGLVKHYRPDLHAFCYERKHAFDFLRELLNIYFEKPTNNMKFGGLDVSRGTLAFLEPLRIQFEELYAKPQKRKSMGPMESDPRIQRGAEIPNMGYTNPSPLHGLEQTQAPPTGNERVPSSPYQPITPPPPPVWNHQKGIWESPAAITPPPPVWNAQLQQWITVDPYAPPIPIPAPLPALRNTPQLMPQDDLIQDDPDEIVAPDTLEEEEVKELPIETVKMKNVDLDPAMFVPLQTGTQIDDYVSLTHGLMPATNIMLQGPAGSGKSSILIDIACQIKKHEPDKRILFISGEMTEIDMKGLVDRFEGFEDLEILFLNKYTEIDTRHLLDTILSAGWDMVIVDSFNEVLGSIIDTATSPMNTRSGEKWLINQFLKHNLGGNELNLPTIFFFILQVGKDGKFVGSNRIKHAATAFLHIEFSKNQNLFLYFSKNRRGDTYNNLFFEHHSKGIHYDFEKYNQDITIREALKRSEIENKESWAKILQANNDDANTTITVKDSEVSSETAELQQAVAGFVPETEQAETLETEPLDVKPILDRRTIHLRQIDLEESIEEIQHEQQTVGVIDEKELDEKVDEVEKDKAKVDISIELETQQEATDKEAERVQKIEDELPFHESEEAMAAADKRNAEREEEAAQSLAEELEEGTSSLSSINLDDDDEITDKEVEDENVGNKTTKDNPNSNDFTTLVEL